MIDGSVHIVNLSARNALAERLRALHDRRHVLLLPNAWDAGSARMLADMGFAAIATTSGGVAWSLGYADGEATPFDELLDAVHRMARAARVPLTVDFEAGFGATPAEVGDSVRAVIDAGAVGINIEDGIEHRVLRPRDEAAARIAAAREAANTCGVPIFINARVDTWIVGGDACDETRLEDALARAKDYLDAGADGIYPMAVSDPDLIARLCARIDAPVNIGARSGLVDIDQLARIGVARVSLATRLAMLAYSGARDAMAHLRDSGRFEGLDASLGYEDMQRLFQRD